MYIYLELQTAYFKWLEMVVVYNDMFLYKIHFKKKQNANHLKKMGKFWISTDGYDLDGFQRTGW